MQLVSYGLSQIVRSQMYARGYCLITDCRMELLYLQFASFRIKASAEYHAQRNKKLEAIMRDHQHQARVARISRPITPQSSRAEDLMRGVQLR